MKGTITFRCCQFAEHDGDCPIDGPVANWQVPCSDCTPHVSQGPFRIVWDVDERAELFPGFAIFEGFSVAEAL